MRFMKMILPFGLCVGTAHAADTVEVWDVGASDIEFYAGLERWREPASQRRAFGEMVWGMGVSRRISTWFSLAHEVDGAADAAGSTAALGMFGSLVDTPHVDVDALLDASQASGALDLAPGLELNLDSRDDVGGWGAYLRVFRSARVAGDGPPTAWTVQQGLYGHVGERAMVLLEGEGAVEGDALTPRLALGLNMTMSDALEWISEAWVTPGEPVPGVLVGFIATIP